MDGHSKLWNVQEAVEWIAFRGAPPIVLRHPADDEACPWPVLDALRARARGKPRSWHPEGNGGGISARSVRALARRWMRAEGLSALEMVNRAADSQGKWKALLAADDYIRRHAEALSVLNDAVAVGKIEVWARSSETWLAPRNPKPRERLPANFVDEVRVIDIGGCLSLKDDGSGFNFLHDQGVMVEARPKFHCFYDIVAHRDDVKRTWSAGDASAAAQTLNVAQRSISQTRPGTKAVAKVYADFRASRAPEMGIPTEAEIKAAFAISPCPGTRVQQMRDARDNYEVERNPRGRPKKSWPKSP